MKALSFDVWAHTFHAFLYSVTKAPYKRKVVTHHSVDCRVGLSQGVGLTMESVCVKPGWANIGSLWAPSPPSPFLPGTYIRSPDTYVSSFPPPTAPRTMTCSATTHSCLVGHILHFDIYLFIHIHLFNFVFTSSAKAVNKLCNIFIISNHNIFAI